MAAQAVLASQERRFVSVTLHNLLAHVAYPTVRQHMSLDYVGFLFFMRPVRPPGPCRRAVQQSESTGR